MGHYVVATTTETGDAGPKTPGAINGGFYPHKPDWPAQHPSVVIAVDDIAAAMEKVRAAGGECSASRWTFRDRPLRVVHRPRRQPRQHAAADRARRSAEDRVARANGSTERCR
jgi:hypothetical protein